MKARSMKMTGLAAAVSIAMLQLGAAWAQDAAPAPAKDAPAVDQASAPAPAAEPGNSLNLDKVIVTGTPVRTTKMKSSSSISTLDADQLQLAAPNSSAEVLHSIPGIHAESSGGEGNANVTVRGVPISAGGSRYVQFQEDGLPILLNGDLNFVTPDMYLKLDGSLGHIEAVRGGAASVLGSNAPGGIINFVSKTGEEEGGSVSLSKGLGFNESRFDYDYGGRISDKTRFFVGGFYRYGDTVRDTGGGRIENGGQLKANITHELGDGSFIRVNFKHLDDQTPIVQDVAYSLSNQNPTHANPATIQPYPGIDPRTATFYSPYWPGVVTRNANNSLTTTNINSGLTVKENALGLVGSFKLGNGWTLDEAIRKSQRSGSFEAGYPASLPFAALPGTKYASGPNIGKPYTGSVTELAAFNTAFDDVGSTVNALKLSKTFDLASSGKLTTVIGWDLNIQNVGVTQNLPHYLFTSGSAPVAVSGLNPSGNATDATGLLPIANGWGSATRSVKYTMDSPYLNLSYENGPFNLDGGVRRDKEKVVGFQTGAGASAAGTPYVPGEFPTVPGQPVDYDASYTSYSLGGNFRINNNLAVFARYSDGAAFNVVERVSGVSFNDGTPVPINIVKQTEGGVKWRDGGFSAFVTLFKAKTWDVNTDVTTGIAASQVYSSHGIEFEGAYRSGGFNVGAGFTYTKSNIDESSAVANVGMTPHRLAKFIYQITPSYRFGDFTIGGSVIGTSQSFGDDANTYIQPGYHVLNLFGNYQIDSRTSVSLSANNLTNEIGWTEFNPGQGARAIDGRSVRVALKYKF